MKTGSQDELESRGEVGIEWIRTASLSVGEGRGSGRVYERKERSGVIVALMDWVFGHGGTFSWSSGST
jgi:hypothetical protein